MNKILIPTIIICLISVMLLSGCNKVSEPISGKNDDKMIEAGEFISETVESEEDVPEETEEKKPEADKATEVVFLRDKQYEANAFLSSFVEQVSNKGQAYSLTTDVGDIEPLVKFVFRYTDMHCYDDFVMDGSDITLTLEQVNELLDRFFGITLTTEQAEGYSIDEHNNYSNGVFRMSLGYGDPFMDVAIVKEIRDLGDGTYEMLFDVYSPSLDEYEGGEKSTDDLYYLSNTEAQALDEIYYDVSGSAIVRPFKYDNQNTYQLIRLDVGE